MEESVDQSPTVNKNVKILKIKNLSFANANEDASNNDSIIKSKLSQGIKEKMALKIKTQYEQKNQSNLEHQK